MREDRNLSLTLFGEGGAAAPGAGGDGAGAPEGTVSDLSARPQTEAQEAEPAPAGDRRPPGIRGQALERHYAGLCRQARELGQRVPDFDLQKELANPMFLKLTGPHVGLSVEDAYVAVHHRELAQAIARGARQELANSIRAGSSRPVEHGVETQAPAVTGFDYQHASRSQREAFKKQILQAHARGEKVYPNQFIGF